MPSNYRSLSSDVELTLAVPQRARQTVAVDRREDVASAER